MYCPVFPTIAPVTDFINLLRFLTFINKQVILVQSFAHISVKLFLKGDYY